MPLLDTNFQKYVDAIVTPLSSIESAYSQIALLPDVDLMTGVNLDVIGQIVGATRVIPFSMPVHFFGFEGQIASMSMGENGNASIGGKFRDEAESAFATSVLADPEFRLLIKSAIFRNYCKGTGNDVLNALSIILNTDKVYVEDIGSMSFGIGIGRLLTYQEEILIKSLDILPRPAGVKISWKAVFDGSNFFGFDNQVGAMGFREEGVNYGGSPFGNEF
jgi:hypothetical protein